MSIKVFLPIGEPKPKQVKVAQKARKPQVAKNGHKKPFTCDQCDKAYGLKHHLGNHVKSVHENAFVCPQCNKKYSNKQILQDHIAFFHEGIRHKCDFCDTTFAQKRYSSEHIKKKHQK